jgi:hypothetical protein
VHDQAARDPDQPPALTEMKALVDRAREGDLEVLPQLREFLDGHPEVWEHCGDIGRHALNSWFDLIAGPDLAAKESLARKADALEAEVAGRAPSPLERLLARRVVACWLQVHHADATVAQAASVSLRQADFARRRQDSAHRRYLMAIGALATVRRLLPAAVEIPDLTAQADVPGPRQATPGEGVEVVIEGIDDGHVAPGLPHAFEPSDGARRGGKPGRPGLSDAS